MPKVPLQYSQCESKAAQDWAIFKEETNEVLKEMEKQYYAEIEAEMLSEYEVEA